MSITRRIFAPTFLAGAATAVAIALAPAASAGSAADCDDDGPTAMCTRNGHAAIVATPNARAGGQFMIAPGGNPFGAQMPPLLAMD